MQISIKNKELQECKRTYESLQKKLDELKRKSSNKNKNRYNNTHDSSNINYNNYINNNNRITSNYNLNDSFGDFNDPFFGNFFAEIANPFMNRGNNNSRINSNGRFRSADFNSDDIW